eukprot:3941137-Rhodomonas_salina.1
MGMPVPDVAYVSTGHGVGDSGREICQYWYCGGERGVQYHRFEQLIIRYFLLVQPQTVGQYRASHSTRLARRPIPHRYASTGLCIGLTGSAYNCSRAHGLGQYRAARSPVGGKRTQYQEVRSTIGLEPMPVASSAWYYIGVRIHPELKDKNHIPGTNCPKIAVCCVGLGCRGLA